MSAAAPTDTARSPQLLHADITKRDGDDGHTPRTRQPSPANGGAEGEVRHPPSCASASSWCPTQSHAQAASGAAGAPAESPVASTASVPDAAAPRPARSLTGRARIIARGPLAGLPRKPATDRRTALDRSQVAELANAAAFAASLGVPFNAMLTVRWGLLPGFVDDDLPRLQTILLDRAARWLGRDGVVLHAVWTRERARGVGLHTGIAMHLPSRRLAQALCAYLERSMGFVTRYGHRAVWLTWGARSHAAWAGSLRYLLKGLDHRAFIYVGTQTANLGVELGIDHRGQQGFVPIKRAGTTQNIGRAARKRAGWRDVRDVAGLRRLICGESFDGSPTKGGAG